MKKLAILGSTGSIGVNACAVIAAHASQFTITALAAGENIGLLHEQIEKFRPAVVSVIDENRARRLKAMLDSSSKTEVLCGAHGYREVAAASDAEMVVSAMTGAAGLMPTLAAIDAGKDIALANKEVMVMAGMLVMERINKKGIRIVPVDSEHSAIFQCLAGHRREDVKRIVLTASGGPFLNCERAELSTIKPAQALRHPNWRMGPKITVDSATLMNKGLEVIEAQWLFGVDIGCIEVMIHPQSIVHSLVEFVDGSMIAQLGMPDMQIPIGYALSYPERLAGTTPSLDLASAGALHFAKPDVERFPSLRLAYEAARIGGTMPAVLNAANEVAVMAFLKEKIPFTAMPRVVEDVLSLCDAVRSPALEDIWEADRWARQKAQQVIEERMACWE